MIKNNFSPIDQWFGINRELKLYQIATIFLAVLCSLMAITISIILNPAPIIIDTANGSRNHFIGKRIGANPTQDDVKIFLTEFIKHRYEIKNGQQQNILKNILPLSTEGYLTALKNEMVKDQSTSQITELDQYTAKIEVIVNEKEALAKFDKIVRFNGVPLIVPTEASFQIVKDSPSVWNPYGVLVNGVIEHETK
jgi:hypothetical protein